MPAALSLGQSSDLLPVSPDAVWAPVPPNGKRCPYTQRTHGDLYRFLKHGQGRKHVRTVHLMEPGASRGRLYFSVGDYVAMMEKLATEQAEARETVENVDAEEATA